MDKYFLYECGIREDEQDYTRSGVVIEDTYEKAAETVKEFYSGELTYLDLFEWED